MHVHNINLFMCDEWMDVFCFVFFLNLKKIPPPAILAPENLTSADMKTSHQRCTVLRNYFHELDQASSSIRCAHLASLLAFNCWRQEVKQQKDGGHLTAL